MDPVIAFSEGNSSSALPFAPTVSVLMITYNHETFVGQAVESALHQETDFQYEIVIGDDASTDRTQDILRDYADRYPEKIRLLLRDKNLGLQGKNNFVDTYRSCRGRFVAILEGDDYWTSPQKLQKQVDFLETHPECTMCFHPVACVDEGGRLLTLAGGSDPQKAFVSLKDIVAGTYVPTCSVMFRAGIINHFPQWYYTIMGGDVGLFVTLAEHGDAGRVDEVMAGYRIHGGGLWNSLDLPEQAMEIIRVYEVINAHLNFKYDREIKEWISWRLCLLSGTYLERREWYKAAETLFKSVVMSPFNPRIPRKKLLLSLLRRCVQGAKKLLVVPGSRR